MRALAAVVLVGVAALHAQAPSTPPLPPPAPGVIVGQAVDGTSGAPIAGALITLSPAPRAMGALSPGDTIPMDQFMSMNLSTLLAGVRQAIADGQGRFAFASVAPGTFSLAATKPGYSGGAYGQRRSDGATTPFILAADGRAGDVKLPLWKNAAIGGRVLDEAGEPIVGVTVRALKRTWLGGRTRYAPAGAGQTDDRGMYRVGALRPGEYVAVIPQTPVTVAAAGGGAAGSPDPAAIQAMLASSGVGGDPSALMATLNSFMGSSSGSGIRVGDWMLRTSVIGGRLIPPAPGEAGRMSAYRTTFYPGASVSSQAVPITIGSGEDRPGIDFQLRPAPVVQIAGAVSKPEGDTRVMQVRLVPSGADELASDSGFESATSTTTAVGTFAFLAVPPGQYTIRVLQMPPAPPQGASMVSGMSMMENAQGNRAVSMGPMTMDMVMPLPAAIPTEPTLWAAQPIAVGDRDLTDIMVPLRQGYRISGRVEFDGTAQKPTSDQLRRIPIVLDRADVGAVTANPLPGLGAMTGRFDENGQFTTSGVVPGRYFLRMPFGLSGWSLKSATVAGRDISDQPLEIENADVTGVTLTLSDRTADLVGALRNAQGQPAAGGSVIAFPAQRDRWVDFGSNPRRLRVAKASPDGHYRIAGLPAGEYFVAATAADVAGDWQNPSFLETLSRTATRVTIGDGEKKTVDLVAR